MTEAQHQMMVLKWTQQPTVRRKWPELALLFHIPNERYCTPQQGKTLQRMGVKRGVPDLCLPVARGSYHALFLEMKAEKGAVSEDQRWWHERLKHQGNIAAVCYGWEAAVHALEWYMGLSDGCGI